MEVSHLHSREEKDLQIQLHGQLGKILIELQVISKKNLQIFNFLSQFLIYKTKNINIINKDEWDLTKGSFMNQTEMEYDQTLQNCFQFLQNSDERVLAFVTFFFSFFL